MTPAIVSDQGLALRGETTVAIAWEPDIVVARQQGRTLASQIGFSATEATLVATAISELARNIILHAGRGEIVLRPLEQGGRCGLVIIAGDNGPGILDVRRAMAGGYSTSGGLGLGLCGVKRIADEFDIVSRLGQGTTVTIRKWRR